MRRTGKHSGCKEDEIMRRWIGALLVLTALCLTGCEVDADLDIRLAEETQPVVRADGGDWQQLEAVEVAVSAR
jgi:hypothetical protein